jgi:hypothetical protein
MELTLGAELELADWSRLVKLSPELGVIDRNDTTVANSDGTCVNPYLETGQGGEICTRVCKNSEDLRNVVQRIFNSLDRYEINHTCWLHIHVGLPEDTFNSLTKLKSILNYVYRNSLQIRDYTSICPVKEGSLMKPEYRIRRNLTRTSVMTDSEYQSAMQATTLEEFWKQFERKRHLVNMVPLKYQSTIEFRCFYMSKNPDRIKEAARFAKDFVLDMLSENPVDVVGLLFKSDYLVPESIAFDARIEERYQDTLVQNRPKIDNFTGKLWGAR